MSLEPQERKQAILDGVREHGLLAGGEELAAATVVALVTAPAFTGDVQAPTAGTPGSVAQETATSGLSPDGPGYGEKLVAAGHTGGTHVIAVSDASLYVFAAEKHHEDRVDARSGAWSREPLGQTFAAWLPFGDHEQGHPGILEVGERRFLVERGDGESAAAVAGAVQAAWA